MLSIKKQYTFTVVGMGYVGMSLASLLGQKHKVYAVDISKERLEMISKGISPIQDEYIEKFLSEKRTSIITDRDALTAYLNSDFVIVSTPTNYNQQTNCFDTESVERVIAEVTACNKNACIVIKSTVPVGFTDHIRRVSGNDNIIFSPEFLRESKALYDNLYPSRIIVGTDTRNDYLKKKAELFADILDDASAKDCNKKIVMGSTEAEAVKLFANTYLALRVSFFNELDTFASIKKLNSKSIIEGVCSDDRIGDFYNNPSFGYGGYCLPKDTKQLLSNYTNVPENLMRAIVDSNTTRIRFIADDVLNSYYSCSCNDKSIPVIGVYKLSMKYGSDNFRESSIIGVMRHLQEKGIQIIVYEPSLAGGKLFLNSKVIKDLDLFKKEADYIITNRYDSSLDDVKEKVYTRDIFGRD